MLTIQFSFSSIPSNFLRPSFTSLVSSYTLFSLELTFLQTKKPRLKMANDAKHHLFLVAFLFFVAALLFQGVEGSRVQSSSHKEGWKREMVGSVAPVCTVNECRGCKYRCIAKQVPVEGNDPINTSYYYKCLCHRL